MKHEQDALRIYKDCNESENVFYSCLKYVQYSVKTTNESFQFTLNSDFFLTKIL